MAPAHISDLPRVGAGLRNVGNSGADNVAKEHSRITVQRVVSIQYEQVVIDNST